MRWLVLPLAALCLALSAPADTYVVHPDGTGDFPTIQAAIDAVVDGDVIGLTNGTFTGDGNRDISYLGKSITVRSMNAEPGDVILDCQGSPADAHRAFLFRSGESSEAILQGVMIVNGYHENNGGAIYMDEYSSPTIDHCSFWQNSAGLVGGAVSCHDSSPRFVNCTFVHNSATGGGAGLCCWAGSPVLDNTIIAFSPYGEAIRCVAGATPTLSCCDLFGNGGGDWVGDHVGPQHGVRGNISDDPMFCDHWAGDFSLDCESPCAPFSPPNPECDLIGAWPVGCGGGSPAIESTWGAVKALFRPEGR